MKNIEIIHAYETPSHLVKIKPAPKYLYHNLHGVEQVYAKEIMSMTHA